MSAIPLTVGQVVVTKYGPGKIIYISSAKSKVYVRVYSRQDALYVFEASQVVTEEQALLQDWPEFVGHSGRIR